MWMWFYAVTLIPIGEQTALSFLAPLFTTMGAAVFLGEMVRMRRWLAIMVGFIGALIIFVCGIAHLSGFIGIEKSIKAGLYPFIYSELLKIALAISLTYLLIKKN